MNFLRRFFGDTEATTRATVWPGRSSSPASVSACHQAEPQTSTVVPFSSPSSVTPVLVWPTPEEQADRRCKMAEESARWSSRNGYELSFYDKDEVPCQTQHAVWGKAHLFNGGWPNYNPGDRPYTLWVCCLCGWTTEQRAASDFLRMPGMVVGVPGTEGNLENAGMVAYLRRVEHLLTHDLKPDPKNSSPQRAERMCLEACNHSCHVLPTPAQFMI